MSVYDRWHTKRPRKGPDGEPLPPCREHKQHPSTDHGKGDRWQVRWRDESGKQCKRNFVKKAGNDPDTCAEAYDAKIRDQINSGSYVDPNAGKITLRRCAEDWAKALTADESTREAIESRLNLHVYPVLGDVEMRVLAKRPSLIQKWISGLQAKLAPSYVKVIFGHVSTIFSAAIDDGIVSRNPCKAGSVRPPRVIKQKIDPWPEERMHAITEALPVRFAGMAVMAAGAGLRQGEILGLAVADVDFLRGIIHVRRQVKIVRNKLVFAPPKGGKERDVPLSKAVGLRLSAHIAATPSVEVALPWKVPSGKTEKASLIFTSATGKAISRNDFNRHVWKPALVAAGVVAKPKRGEKLGPLRELGMHQLRHFYASSLLSDGVDVRTLAEYLGHADPGFTLRIYCHLMPSSEDRARSAVDRVFGEKIDKRSAQNVPHAVVSRA